MPTIESLNPDVPLYARTGINLASAGLGAQAITATNEFFGPAERMLSDPPAVFYPDRFDENGKWMDGWESQRRRDGGHDHAVIKLAAPGRLLGFDVDTSHFTGNYAPACKIEACSLSMGSPPDEDTKWIPVLKHSPLSADAHHFFKCDSFESWTHLRLHIYPDGGVARLRVFGVPELDSSGDGQDIDLASSLNGGRVLALSDAHYGDFTRLLAPGRGVNMGDGWETRRRREPGYDWMIIALGARGIIDKIVVDTAHFKGNFPDRCSFQGADLQHFGDGLTDALVTDSMFWPILMKDQRLSADAIHSYVEQVECPAPVTHIRFNIHPDGGVSRLRLFGRPLA